jgi:hypothetical protein
MMVEVKGFLLGGNRRDSGLFNFPHKLEDEGFNWVAEWVRDVS